MHDLSGLTVYSGKILIDILVPVFNDWESLSILLAEIDAVLGISKMRGHVTIVDDGSTLAVPDQLRQQNYSHLAAVEVVRLRCNLGHQRAIAVGLAYLTKKSIRAHSIVVMDGDGQDRPQDIPSLITELDKQQCNVVFAARAKRSEEFAFRCMYRIYRLIHWLLTGISIRWGNFSAISSSVLPGLLARPEVWNHYAAAIARSRIPFSTVSLPRGRRYLGESHMRYSSLVVHGLSGIAVFSEVVAVRIMILFSGILAALMICLGIEIIERHYALNAIYQWTAIAIGVLIISALQGFMTILLFSLTILDRRSQAMFVPLEDAVMFVESTHLLFSATEN